MALREGASRTLLDLEKYRVVHLPLLFPWTVAQHFFPTVSQIPRGMRYPRTRTGATREEFSAQYHHAARGDDLSLGDTDCGDNSGTAPLFISPCALDGVAFSAIPHARILSYGIYPHHSMTAPDFSTNKFFWVLMLETMLPFRVRRWIARLSAFGIIGTIAALFVKSSNTPWLSIPITPLQLTGIFFLCLGLRSAIVMLNAFFYAKTADMSGDTAAPNVLQRLNWYAAEAWYRAARARGDITTREFLEAFPKTDAGQIILLRLGIAPAEYIVLLKALPPDTPPISLSELLESDIEKPGGITLAKVLDAIATRDVALPHILNIKRLRKESLEDAAAWIERTLTQENLGRRWWSHETLGRIPGIGKNWAYGYTRALEQFAEPLRYDPRKATGRMIGKEREISLLERALLKGKSANVIIVGQPGVGKRALLYGLARLIEEGKVFPELEHKRILELATSSLVAQGKTKGEIESLLLGVLNEAQSAGNVMLVIDDLPEFIATLEALGISASALFAPYLQSQTLHLVALANTQSFQRTLEARKEVMQYFEKVEVAEPSIPQLIEILEDAAPQLETEYRNRTIITAPALGAIAEGAARYLVSGALPERAMNLLREVAGECVAQGQAFCDTEAVQAYLEKKTKIPLGAITPEEQEKLLALEDKLHERVIDQNEAIAAIANAIKRSRANLTQSQRPIGTFLFLGPTGVGKTETAKALAATYFGNEDAMIRFDMTEYKNEEALARLIGSFEKNEPGILANKMRSSPYGVLLLDEFEKAHSKVVDLFLQILDEGFFSDAFGERVNVRNTIIIATSNAGAVLIADLIRQGVNDPAAMKSQIVSDITKKGVFKPELLNRFDTIVMFRPLGEKELGEIARLMLGALGRRLAEQNIRVRIDDALIGAVVRGGFDPQFGARPMRRFIQDHIEKIIAEKIIKGELKAGDEYVYELHSY